MSRCSPSAPSQGRPRGQSDRVAVVRKRHRRSNGAGIVNMTGVRLASPPRPPSLLHDEDSVLPSSATCHFIPLSGTISMVAVERFRQVQIRWIRFSRSEFKSSIPDDVVAVQHYKMLRLLTGRVGLCSDEQATIQSLLLGRRR